MGGHGALIAYLKNPGMFKVNYFKQNTKKYDFSCCLCISMLRFCVIWILSFTFCIPHKLQYTHMQKTKNKIKWNKINEYNKMRIVSECICAY